MNLYLAIFLAIVLTVAGLAGYLLRGTWAELAKQAQLHAAAYAVSYLKGTALILIAGGACFTETFGSLTAAEAASWQWWDWMVAFWKPVAAALACMVAFLDQSASAAKRERESQPPFSK